MQSHALNGLMIMTPSMPAPCRIYFGGQPGVSGVGVAANSSKTQQTSVLLNRAHFERGGCPELARDLPMPFTSLWDQSTVGLKSRRSIAVHG